MSSSIDVRVKRVDEHVSGVDVRELGARYSELELGHVLGGLVVRGLRGLREGRVRLGRGTFLFRQAKWVI